MKKFAVTAWVCSMLLMQCNRAERPMRGQNTRGGKDRIEATSQEVAGIDKEAAISIATEDAKKKGEPLSEYYIHPCELPEEWVIIFELKEASSDGRGPEYRITKSSGHIYDVEVVPHGFAASTKKGDEKALASGGMSAAEAIAISNKDLSADWLSTLNVTACETTRTWRVLYSHKEHVDGFTPETTIDKRTGKIIEKKMS